MGRLNSYILQSKFIILLVFITSNIQATNLAPLGTIKINDSMCVDEAEINVGCWLAYYNWIYKYKGLLESKEILPDSNLVDLAVWKLFKEYRFNDINTTINYKEIFFNQSDLKSFLNKDNHLSKTSIALLDMPITGVSYNQVLNFCKWRTTYFADNNIEYKLPSLAEWKQIAKIVPNDSLFDRKYPCFNYRINYHIQNEVFNEIRPNGSFPSNNLKIMDFWGNVSEMLEDTFMAAGGNYNLYAYQMGVDSFQYYTKAEKWLGFRCVYTKNRKTENSELVIVNEKAKNLFTDKRDNSQYKIIKIDDKFWMAENLRYKPSHGEYWLYNNDMLYRTVYGYLYNWEVAQNVCPEGWHLPSKEEFEDLIKYTSNNYLSPFKELILNGKIGLDIIESSLYFRGGFTPTQGGSAFWLSSQSNLKNAYGVGIGFETRKIFINNNYSKKWGLQVRFVRNY
jgi:uncharacterized protein (TIGR02145 family)